MWPCIPLWGNLKPHSFPQFLLWFLRHQISSRMYLNMTQCSIKLKKQQQKQKQQICYCRNSQGLIKYLKSHKIDDK